MPDITTPMIINDIARHLRTCAVLVADDPSITFLLHCAHQLDARAKEIREDTPKQAPVARPVNPEKNP